MLILIGIILLILVLIPASPFIYRYARSFIARERQTADSAKAWSYLQVVMQEALLEVKQLEEEQQQEFENRLLALKELIQYSDPVIHSSLVNEEQHLIADINQLPSQIGAVNGHEDRESALHMLRDKIITISEQIKLRNKQLLTVK
ncbi:hypothetical protein [Paenibacillus sp. YIM B09110]|uniref:hypothetical protein n=1 Tax=Paenibacillus sp. YIM B09110 TaxID=3126102 RepID=UPI00301E01DF